jgi:hypothetical protein
MSDPAAEMKAAWVPQRSLVAYTAAATVPLIALSAFLLFGVQDGTLLMLVTIAGALVNLVAFGALLYETSFDIAGYPEYKLPIWAVFYLVIYLIVGFMFVIYAIHTLEPGTAFAGISSKPKVALLDTLYLSLCNYVGVPADSTFGLKNQTSRFISVGQGFLSMFLNVVIITKFVSSL